MLLDALLPRSYSHLLLRLTLDRFPPTGVGVGGPSPNTLDDVLAPNRLEVLAPNRLDDVLAPSGLPGEPNDDDDGGGSGARASAPDPPTALCSSGLTADDDGECCDGRLSLDGDGE